MRDLGQRLIVGLAVVAVGVMVIGYAFIAGRIATPIANDLGTFELRGDEVAAIQLEDGRPAFLVPSPGEPHVLDARAPHPAGSPGRLVTWCVLPSSGFFLDLVSGATFDPDGRVRSEEPNGLVAYPVRTTDDATRITVGSDGRDAGVADGERVALDCPSNEWVGHGPARGETFDPSVAVTEEPPGWIWVEGRLVAMGSEVELCDRLDGPCASGAAVAGIDPAQVPAPALAGHFLGRVRDGVIVDLHFVPDAGGSR